MINRINKKIFDFIPENSELLRKLSTRYIDRYNNDNNTDIISNGEAKLIKSVIAKLDDGIVLDVGANIGEWSRFCISEGCKADLHLFEPSEMTFKKLSNQVWPHNTYLHNFGFGETKEIVELHIFEELDGMNSLYPRKGIEKEIVCQELVQIKTIDEFSDESKINSIDFIKIDVEGHELSVLKGAKRMLRSKKIKMIQFEYGGCNLDSRVFLGDIWDYLSGFDFKIAKVFPNQLTYINKYDQCFENFKYSNWFAQLS